MSEVAQSKSSANIKPGTKRIELSNPQIGKFLSHIRSGIGRVIACEKMEISYKTFLRIYDEDPEFAAQVRAAEKARIESCEATLYRIATCTYNDRMALRAAVSYLGRRDKLDEASRARRERKNTRAAKSKD